MRQWFWNAVDCRSGVYDKVNLVAGFDAFQRPDPFEGILAGLSKRQVSPDPVFRSLVYRFEITHWSVSHKILSFVLELFFHSGIGLLRA